MIQIDRTSDVPLHAQLTSRLRFLIASGHFSTGDLLPSTRAMAKQLGISFHTVRRAYLSLEEEHYLEARQGAGFSVVDHKLPSKSSRMEQGATIVHDALQQLIGLGFDEHEIDYLIQEQSSILETEDLPYKMALVGAYREWSEQCAEQLSDKLQKRVIPIGISDLVHHADADFIVVPFRLLRSILTQAPNADVIGVQAELSAESLSQVARLLERETLGLVTRYADAIGPLTSELREQTRFSGQILAVSVEHGDSHVAPVLSQSDLVLYTQSAWRTIKPSSTSALRQALITFEITEASIERLRQLIPT
ncbi:MAG: GntR family transcriptional regulator [Rhodothermia bacterium]|nr:MAG: GntR family transcriptional regulator [Rhodothermia bacterium]